MKQNREMDYLVMATTVTIQEAKAQLSELIHLAECVFRTKLDTDSMGNWTVFPRESGHLFQRDLDGIS